jgi:hypothetical protein
VVFLKTRWLRFEAQTDRQLESTRLLAAQLKEQGSASEAENETLVQGNRAIEHRLEQMQEQAQAQYKPLASEIDRYKFELSEARRQIELITHSRTWRWASFLKEVGLKALVVITAPESFSQRAIHSEK